MGVEHFFNFTRINILTATDNQIFEAASDPAITARVHRAQIAGVQPTLFIDGCLRGLGHCVIAQHHQKAPGTQFTGLVDGQRGAAAGINNFNLDLRNGAADGLAFVLRVVVHAGVGDGG